MVISQSLALPSGKSLVDSVLIVKVRFGEIKGRLAHRDPKIQSSLSVFYFFCVYICSGLSLCESSFDLLVEYDLYFENLRHESQAFIAKKLKPYLSQCLMQARLVQSQKVRFISALCLLALFPIQMKQNSFGLIFKWGFVHL